MRKTCITLLVTLMLIFQLSYASSEVFVGGAKGFGGDITCYITVDEAGKIVDIEIDALNETPGIGKEAIEPMIKQLLKVETTEVKIEEIDTYAGATVTSRAIVEAFNKAMASSSTQKDAESIPVEGFSLRNSIVFGDSMTEVRSKEKLPIDKEDTSYEADEDYPYSLTTFTGRVAGVSGTYIVYNFDSNKQLKEVIYWMNESSSMDSIDAQYETINAGLVRKYGDPLKNKDGKTHLVVGSAIDLANYTVGLMNTYGGYAGIRNYDEWIVAENGYYVKIEQVEYYAGQSLSKTYYQQVLSYTYFTESDVESNVADYEKKQRQIDADL